MLSRGADIFGPEDEIIGRDVFTNGAVSVFGLDVSIEIVPNPLLAYVLKTSLELLLDARASIFDLDDTDRRAHSVIQSQFTSERQFLAALEGGTNPHVVAKRAELVAHFAQCGDTLGTAGGGVQPQCMRDVHSKLSVVRAAKVPKTAVPGAAWVAREAAADVWVDFALAAAAYSEAQTKLCQFDEVMRATIGVYRKRVAALRLVCAALSDCGTR